MGKWVGVRLGLGAPNRVLPGGGSQCGHSGWNGWKDWEIIYFFNHWLVRLKIWTFLHLNLVLNKDQNPFPC